jgi:hypothetical protein
VLLVLLVVVAVAAGVYYETGAAQQKPGLVDVSFVGVSLIPSDPMNVVIQLALGIHNHASGDITFRGMLYTLYGNELTLDAGYIRQNQPLASGSVFVLNNTYRAELSDTTLQSVNKDTSMSWRISGTVDFATAAGNQTSPFSVTFQTQ